ncbi:MAG: cupin domain-containing protein [Acetobacteraceae bacterium]|nr:cupin domain-containing protein [Pseudomonadota bacterium]
MSSETTDETAGLYFLGMLDVEERTLVEQRLATDAALRQALDDWSRRLSPLLEVVPPATPPAAVWTAIRARIGAPGTKSSRRHDQGSWVRIAPGAELRFLHVDPVGGGRSAFLRMDAGSAVPAHDHEELEECFVIDGTVVIDGEHYEPGDHVIAGAGTQHATIHAATPVRMLLHWSAAPA